MRKDFTVGPGETLDLGDILIENPKCAMNRRVGRDAIHRVKAHRESRGIRWASRRQASFDATLHDTGQFMPRLISDSPWARYVPTPEDPWDLRKVAHLHRRAGFGATWTELLRDRDAGPDASIDRLLHPPQPTTEEADADEAMRREASPDLLKVCWLHRILYWPDPLREKMTLFWHGHFATSIKKVESVTLMDRQNQTLRTHALGSFAGLLEAIIADPAMLVWLDGGDSKKEKPNENFAREFLELFTLGAGNYSERDIREAARAFTGWVRQNDRVGFRATPFFAHDPAQVDDRPKTFLGRDGRWGTSDIVRITLEHAGSATFLARKFYRWFVSEAGIPGPELIEPLAKEVRRNQFTIGPIVEVILRSQHFYSRAALRRRIKSPVEHQRRPGPDARGAPTDIQPAGALGRLRRARPRAVRPAQRRGVEWRPGLDQQQHTP